MYQGTIKIKWFQHRFIFHGKKSLERVSFITLEDLYWIRQTVNFSFASVNSLSHENKKAISPVLS